MPTLSPLALLLLASVAAADAANLPDRSTPASTAAGFLDAAHARDWDRAATYLSLSHLPEEARLEEGRRLARRLIFLLDRHLWLDFGKISADPAGDPAEPGVDTLGELTSERGARAIRLRRSELPGVGQVWLFSEGTVRAIDPLFEALGSPLFERLPGWLFSRTFWVLELWQWAGLLLLALFALFGGVLGERLLLRLGQRAARISKSGWDDQLIAAGQGPLRFAILAIASAAAARALLLPPPAKLSIDLVSTSLGIVAGAWFLLRFAKLGGEFLERRVAERSGQDAGQIRGVKTQLAVLRHVVEAAIYVLAVSLLLLQFAAVRSIGVSLLASAGVAGLVIGLAAQKSISTLLAGIQLSITQPMRIGDTVIVENEWGWIEEITLTYVVVKVWDLRRLVVPMTWFLERPFQNWTKNSPDIMGTVELFTDFRADIGALRSELQRVLRDAPEGLWDGKVQGIQVTGATDRAMTVRVLVSSKDAGLNWDLRCLVREKLLTFLQQQPAGLPLVRAEAQHQFPPGLLPFTAPELLRPASP